MLSRIDLTWIKGLILIFWAAWLSVVASTNILNALQALELVPATFRFVSGNWAWINQVMDPLGLPRGLQAFLFAGVIGWESIAAVCYWRAVGAYRGRTLSHEPEVLLACFVNLALWSVFQVLDEVVLAFQPEAVHRAIFVAQLAALVVLWLPSDPIERTHPNLAQRLAALSDAEAETLPETEAIWSDQPPQRSR